MCGVFWVSKVYLFEKVYLFVSEEIVVFVFLVVGVVFGVFEIGGGVNEKLCL